MELHSFSAHGDPRPKPSVVAVLGVGAWGLALAQVARRRGHRVMAWGRPQDLSHVMPEHVQGIDVTADLALTTQAAYVVVAVPAQAVRSVLAAWRQENDGRRTQPRLTEAPLMVVCSKGIEQNTGLLLDDVVADVLPNHRHVLLSGPNLAHEIRAGLPAGATVAGQDWEDVRSVMELLGSSVFRLYGSTDIKGVALAGALKNVLALACGIVMGYGLGENARSTLMMRGLTQMVRLGEALGVSASTWMGLAGMGDMVLTCASTHSRNARYGWYVGDAALRQDTVHDPDRYARLRSLYPLPLAVPEGTLVEGVCTAPAARCLWTRHGVSMPVFEAVHNLLEKRCTVSQAVDFLLEHPAGHPEHD